MKMKTNEFLKHFPSLTTRN